MDSLNKPDEISKIRRYAVTCSVLWTLLLSSLFAAYVIDNRETVLEIAQSMAQVSFEKDVLFRRWAARHGGVYAPITAETPANPYLKDIPERDFSTPSGKRLTLINPAYMSRQIFEFTREQPNIPQGHITSLNPLRPENAPDAWEAQALKRLQQGAKEVVEPVLMDGTPHLRFMRPLITEKPCLRCHAAQGYKEGDGRGGISVTLSLVPIQKTMNNEMLHEFLIHSFIWLIGMVLILFGTQRITRITKSLRNERNNLFESEQRFRSLSDTAPVLIWMSDLTKGCTFFNKGWCDFTGRKEAELLGDGWAQDVHPDDLDECIRIYENAFDERLIFSMEYRLRRHDGAYRWILDNGVPRWNNETDFIGYIGSCIDITERKQVEAELRNSKEHYSAIVNAFDGQIYICSQDYKILFMNQSMIERTGCNAVGQSCFKALHNLEAVCPWCVNDRVFKGETVKWEVLSPKDDHWYYVVNTPIHNVDGTISKQAMIHDITERKRAETILQARIRLSEYALTCSLDGLLTKTLDELEALTGSTIGFFHFLDSDQQTLLLQAWSTRTLTSMCTAEGKHKHYPVDRAGVWVDCVRQRQPVMHNDYASLPNRKGLPQGHATVLRELVVPIFRGDLIMGIIGIGNKQLDYVDADVDAVVQLGNLVWDIIVGKQAQEDLLKNEALLNSTQRLAKIGGWKWDVECQDMFWTEETYRIHGFEPDTLMTGSSELIEKSLLCYDVADRQVVLDAFRRCAERGQEYDLEFPFTTADGRKIWIRTTAQAVWDGDRVVKVVGNIMDVTDRKQAEAERIALEQQFHHAQKLESLGVLAGGIAHDFNNILTVIMGHCYLVKEEMIPEQEYKQAIQKIESAGNRAADLCRQMLTYAGKSPLVQTRVNLWLLVDEVVRMLQAAIKKNVAIELAMQRVVPEIQGDTGQIQQIIMNLIINAAEAIGENIGTVRVALTRVLVEADHAETNTFGTVIPVGGYICLEVTDTGSGMDEETQNRIFEPFYTTKFTGRGLGMSAIHGIIKSHEAHLHMTSTPGIGTTFKVFFPVAQSSDFSETDSIVSVPCERAGGTILLVEDEEILRSMGATMLNALGFIAMTASDGREALQIYSERESEIDVVLMDLIMPVMGGIDAYHELRKSAPSLPIVFCSGYSVELVDHIIKNDQQTGFVPKPYKPDELRDMMARMMESHHPDCS